jgi:anaerobic magnesium-protoporphyrin IX monomethyl ester cyclase
MDKSILLIFPPFAAARNPYASLPVLAAYLRARHIKVKCVDANIEFFHRFLTPERIVQAQETVASRLLRLNHQSKLKSTEEKSEYLTLARAILQSQRYWQDLPRVFDVIQDGQKIPAFFAALSVASLTHYPEMLSVDPKTLNLRYQSISDPFSTRSILEILERDSLLAGYFEDLLYPILEREAPRVVGLSVAFSLQIAGAFRCAKAIKNRFPQIHVVLGGGFVSGCMRQVENPQIFEVIDSLVLDDGEVPLERLVHELATPEPRLNRIPGLVYREEGKIKRNAPEPPLPLEALPSPDFLTLDLDRYLQPREAIWLPLRTSRGCAWGRCAFCRTDLSVVCHHQSPPADYLYDSIREVIYTTGVTNFSFSDEASDPKVLEKLSRRFIQDRLSCRWATNVRFHPDLTLERFTLYREAGARAINMGLETYNDRLLKLVQKGIKTEWINQVLTNMAWAGMNILVYMIVGFPTETEAEALQSFWSVAGFVKMGLLSNFKYNQLQIMPYSAMYNDPARFGITRLYSPKNQDLEGPIFNFDAPGMSRRKAFRLCSLFNGEGVRPIPEVIIEGRPVKLNFDVVKISEELNSMRFAEPAPADSLEKAKARAQG